ncbi:MAG: succinate dehydrogenase assembly factor 2 [Pseudomonadota bacterium]
MEREKRRLRYRATKRGMRELDLLIGGFAAARIDRMEPHELGVFAQILELDEPLLERILTNKISPDSLDPELAAMLQSIIDWAAIEPPFQP